MSIDPSRSSTSYASVPLLISIPAKRVIVDPYPLSERVGSASSSSSSSTSSSSLKASKSISAPAFFEKARFKVLTIPNDFSYKDRIYLSIDRVKRENIGTTSTSSSSSLSSSDEIILESLKDLYAATDRYSFYNLVMLCRDPEYKLAEYSEEVCVPVFQAMKLMDLQKRIPDNVRLVVLTHVSGSGNEMEFV